MSSQDIGRWGEDFAVKALLAKFKKKYIDDYPQLSGERLSDGYARVTNGENLFVGIHWCNSDRESNDSPDILVIENVIKTYWEVKSTRTGDRTNFTVTPHERDFAKEKGDKFWMLRVCYAGSLKARAYEIPNPYLTQDTILPMPSDKQQSVSQELQPVSGLKNPDDKYYNGFGRYIDDKGKIRSTAWVRLIPNGTGNIFISRKVGRKYKYAFSQVSSLENNYYRAFELLRSAKISDKFNVQIFLKGGYPSDQIKAIQSGLEQALIKFEHGL